MALPHPAFHQLGFIGNKQTAVLFPCLWWRQHEELEVLPNRFLLEPGLGSNRTQRATLGSELDLYLARTCDGMAGLLVLGTPWKRGVRAAEEPYLHEDM